MTSEKLTMIMTEGSSEERREESNRRIARDGKARAEKERGIAYDDGKKHGRDKGND